MLSWKDYLWYTAFSLYSINMGVGLAAQLRWLHFGWMHHLLYFFVFASAITTTWLCFHPLLLVTLGTLTYMPMSRPGTWKHPTAACVGYAGYVLSWLWA